MNPRLLQLLLNYPNPNRSGSTFFPFLVRITTSHHTSIFSLCQTATICHVTPTLIKTRSSVRSFVRSATRFLLFSFHCCHTRIQTYALAAAAGEWTDGIKILIQSVKSIAESLRCDGMWLCVVVSVSNYICVFVAVCVCFIESLNCCVSVFSYFVFASASGGGGQWSHRSTYVCRSPLPLSRAQNPKKIIKNQIKICLFPPIICLFYIWPVWTMKRSYPPSPRDWISGVWCCIDFWMTASSPPFRVVCLFVCICSFVRL